jgi:uncharacterized protein (AIM24 family)
MQYVEITLDPGQMCIGEPGGMMYMTPGIQMNTMFGDPSAQNQGGIFGKVLTAGKRVLTGENLFITTFTNAAPSGREQVAFAAPFPGKIIPMHLEDNPGDLGFEPDASRAHWPDALMKELTECHQALQAAAASGKKFRFLIVS